jgi:glycerophosphoryl diester phosphodiesterase
MSATLAFLACVLLPGADDQVAPVQGFPFFEPVRPPRSIQVMAHRGAREQAPENTARALEHSIADTVEWVEVDVRLTRDGHHVLFHDVELDGKTDGTGRVRDHTLAEVRALDAGSKFARRFAGERILTLEEGLKLARGRVNLYLDGKDIDPAHLAREVLAAGMGRQVVVYDEPEALRAVRAVAGEGVGLMTKWRPRYGLASWVESLRPHAVEIDAVDVTPEACREFHRRGIKVQAKTLGGDDRPEVWDRVVAAGADWIQTDHAEEILARQSLKAAGPGRVKVAHHRGASRYAPENTLEALQKAAALVADFVEFDVRTTRDGAFVLLHDGTLGRTTSGRGAVRERTADEVSGLDAGSWFGRPFAGANVPTLDAFLDAAAKTGVELYVDAKDIAPEALAAALERHGLSEQAVVYQGAGYLERLKAIAPAVRRMPPLHDPDALDALAERVCPYAVDTRWTILSRPLIDRCHALGIKVFSDALGSHESIEHYQRAVRDGIDLIQTDHPVRVLRAFELLGHPVPGRP